MPTPESPKCTVIIPVYEHWSLIPALMTCLRDQTVPQREFEVLLIDNGSSHVPAPLDLPSNASLHVCDTPGSYAARNLGIAHARGGLLVFTDADCRPYPDWLEKLTRSVHDSADRQVIVAGAVEVVGRCSRPNAYEMYDMVKGIPQDWYVSRGYAATANLAVPASVAHAVGGFDVARYSGGDADFCKRAVAAGSKLRYEPNAVVQHPARETWEALVTKARRVKGGQLTAGTARWRLVWLLRTLTPPTLAFWRFMRKNQFPLRYRLVAMLIQLRIWPVEIREALKLTLFTQPERR